MANRTVIRGEHRDLEAVAPACHWIGIDVAYFNARGEGREQMLQLGDEFVA